MIKRGVEKLRVDRGFGKGVPDCFAPWYLNQFHSLSEDTATRQSSDGSGDFGLDGFALLDNPAQPPKLLLLQAKYSHSVSDVRSGIGGFKRLLPELAKMLDCQPTEVGDENKVLVNLRAKLNELDPVIRGKLQLEFSVIHLCEEPTVVLSDKTDLAKNDLRREIEELLSKRLAKISTVGPLEMGPRVDEVIVPPEEIPLTFAASGDPLVIPTGRMWLGLGKLSEVAELYHTRGADLFQKNVRLFIRSKKKRERGPSGKMKDALNRICCSTREPLAAETFAFSHNGVTLVSKRVSPNGGSVVVVEPYILNGCQTIMTAYLFRNDPTLRTRIDEAKWRSIPVPMRIIETRDEDMVKQITINSNRQNAIRAVALRANDDIQLKLEERFRQVHILFERQENAFAEVEASHPEDLENEYQNSSAYPMKIETLGRCLAAAGGDIRNAEHPQDLFEGDTPYGRTFSSKHLRSIRFLVFLQNVHDDISTTLKKDVRLSQQEGGPAPSRLTFYALCLVLRYLAKGKRTDEVIRYSTKVFAKFGSVRDALSGWMLERVNGTTIAQTLKSEFLALQRPKAEDMWNAFNRAERTLRLTSVWDPFEVFADLDSLPLPERD